MKSYRNFLGTLYFKVHTLYAALLDSPNLIIISIFQIFAFKLFFANAADFSILR